MNEPTTDVIQGTLDLLILKTLSLEPMHGFGIARRVEQVSRGVFKVNPGSLLTALRRLERAGWIDAEWRATENARRARFYTLTRAGRGPARGPAAAWRRHLRPRRGARLRMGEPRQHAAGRRALCRAAPASKPRFQGGGRPDAGAGHRCGHSDHQRRQSHPVRAAAVPPLRAGWHDPRERPQRRGYVRHVFAARRAQPLAGGDGGAEAMAAGHDRARRAGATGGAARQRRLLPGAESAARRGSRLRASRRSNPGTERRDPQRRALAPALCRRPRDPRARDQARRHSLHGHRRDAARFRERTGAGRRAVGAAAVRRVAPAAGTGVGPSSDDDRPLALGRRVGRSHQGDRCPRARGARRAASGHLRPEHPVRGRVPARRADPRRQAGAPRHPWRGDARARDRLRERDEPAPRPGRATARRVRAARRARRRARPAGPAVADGEPAPRRGGGHGRHGGRGDRRAGARCAESGRPAARWRHPRRCHDVRVRPGLFALPIGFDASGLLTMQVQIAGHRFDDRAASHRFFVEALDAVRRVPGVSAAGLTAQLPFSGDRDEYGALFEAAPNLPAYTYAVFRYAVSPGYLETMGIPLLGGRLLDERDAADAPLAVVISESLARARFHDREAIGERLRIGPAGPFTIVGVVGNVKQMSLALSETDAVYLNAAQSWFADRAMSLVVRARGDAAALAPLVRQAVWSVDKDQPVVRAATMEEWLAASEAERRFALVVFEVFALAALVLAAIGIYGILSGSVTERTREIGVRSALGASRAGILVLVLRQGMTLTVLGVAIGVGGAVVASRALVTLLFGVSRLGPFTYLGVVAILLAASAVACWLPAWRAARVDPSITLRSE